MREFCTSGSVGGPGEQSPGSTRPWQRLPDREGALPHRERNPPQPTYSNFASSNVRLVWSPSVVEFARLITFA
jgi:hypothetical protein